MIGTCLGHLGTCLQRVITTTPVLVHQLEALVHKSRSLLARLLGSTVKDDDTVAGLENARAGWQRWVSKDAVQGFSETRAGYLGAKPPRPVRQNGFCCRQHCFHINDVNN